MSGCRNLRSYWGMQRLNQITALHYHTFICILGYLIKIGASENWPQFLCPPPSAPLRTKVVAQTSPSWSDWDIRLRAMSDLTSSSCGVVIFTFTMPPRLWHYFPLLTVVQPPVKSLNWGAKIWKFVMKCQLTPRTSALMVWLRLRLVSQCS